VRRARSQTRREVEKNEKEQSRRGPSCLIRGSDSIGAVVVQGN
jgi:hypothetical protein